MNAAAAEIIAALKLAPLPGEGGFFRATWRTTTGSSIYFLITADDFSALHRISHDELWHFYGGDPVDHVQIDPDNGHCTVARMGPAVLAGDQPQVIVPAGRWQGARLAPAPAGENPARFGHGYTLFGCTVSPPWDERGCEIAVRAELIRQFPAQAGWITALTR